MGVDSISFGSPRAYDAPPWGVGCSARVVPDRLTKPKKNTHPEMFTALFAK